MSQLSNLYDQLINQFQQGDTKITSTLSALKLELAKLSFLTSNSSLDTDGLIKARDILEIGALVSVNARDISAFERYITQLFTFYVDFKNKLPISSRYGMMVGLNLMNLIASNRIAAFHLSLESLDPTHFELDRFIQFPVELEKALMEGSYNKVLNSRSKVPESEFGYFMDLLADTIRGEIASCCEKAYKKLPIQQIGAMLFYAKTDEVIQFSAKRGWIVNVDQSVVFHPVAVASTSSELDSQKVLDQAMFYAKELDRIV